MTDRLEAVVSALGWSLVHFLWQGLVIAALLELVLAAMRASSAAARYVVRCAGLALMVLAPIVTFLALWGADVTPSGFEPVFAGTLRSLESAATGLERALPWIVLGWSLGATLLGVRLWIGCRRIGRLRAAERGSELPAPTRASFERIARQLRVRATARVIESVRLAAPAVVGWLRPVVLFPAHVLTGLSPDQIECLIVHELAHVRRHDFLVNVLQSAVEAALFYHPAVWWVSAGIRTEREFCCDDVALRVTRNGVTYARALTTLESWRGAADPEPSVSLLGGSLMQRIQRLIDSPDAPRRSRGGIVVHALLPFLAAGTLGVAALGWTADEPEPPAQEPATDSPRDVRWTTPVFSVSAGDPAAAPDVNPEANPFEDDLAERVRAIRESLRSLSEASASAELTRELAELEERLSEIDRLMARDGDVAPSPKPNPFQDRWVVKHGSDRPRWSTPVEAPSPFESSRHRWAVQAESVEASERDAPPPPAPAPHPSRMTWTVEVEWGPSAPAPPEPTKPRASGSWRTAPGAGSQGRYKMDWDFDPGEFTFDPGQFKFEPGQFKFDPEQFKFEPGDFEFDPEQFKFEPGNFEFDPEQFKFEPGDFKFDPEQFKFEPGDFKFDPEQFKFEPGDFKFDPEQFKFDPEGFHFDPEQASEWFERSGEKGSLWTPKTDEGPCGEASPTPRKGPVHRYFFEPDEREPQEPSEEPAPEKVREPPWADGT